MLHLAYISDEPLPLNPEELSNDPVQLQQMYDRFIELHHEHPLYASALDIILAKMKDVCTREPEH